MPLPPRPYSDSLSSGGFEPPGANSVAAFVAEYDRSVDPRWLAAEIRAAKAEETAAQVTAGEV
jgi:hypothetical protein